MVRVFIVFSVSLSNISRVFFTTKTLFVYFPPYRRCQLHCAHLKARQLASV